MKAVYAIADNVFSPIGVDTVSNLHGVMVGETGVRQVTDTSFSATPFYSSAFQQFPVFEGDYDFTRFETLCIASISNALQQTDISLGDKETIFILSTTKGNIELLGTKNSTSRLSLSDTAQLIAGHFGALNAPLVVSNACISGVAAIILAQRLLAGGKYKHAVITGADIVSRFVVSGFQCLYAMSDEPCRPFDKDRKGINIGECAATAVLTTNAILNSPYKIRVNDGAITNDANHISGPSRTGQELSFAVHTAMQNGGINVEQLSFISAHGTATVYNDDMESRAFALSGLSEVPLHSLKGNFGHTLGAAGVVESVLTYRSLQQGIILPSKNFNEPGVPEKITVNTSLKKSGKQHALKTASGFGGCNAAIIYSIT